MKEMSLKQEVGERLKESRKQAGYTQAAVAGIMHMTQQQYSRFENGVFELNYMQIVELCKLYDVSADYLFGLKIF
jgi:transcriptional regulator with XRE-family HTH domain